MEVPALNRRIDRSLYSADAPSDRCVNCGRTDLPLTDVRCTSELSGEVWHNVYCANCLVVCVSGGYLTHNERARRAGSILERIVPVIAEPMDIRQPPRALTAASNRHRECRRVG